MQAEDARLEAKRLRIAEERAQLVVVQQQFEAAVRGSQAMEAVA